MNNILIQSLGSLSIIAPPTPHWLAVGKYIARHLSSVCLQKVSLSTEDVRHMNFNQFSFTVHECSKNAPRPSPLSDFGLDILHNMQFLFCKLHEQL